LAGEIDMKAIGEFLKTCLLGGLFALLPLLIFFLLFSQLIDAVVALATPIAGLFPEQTFDKLSDPVFVAIPLLLVASFIFGLALRSRTLTRAGSWIERTTLMRVPLYHAVKRLGQGLTGAESENAFKSGLLHNTDGTSDLVYIIEDHGDGKLTILIPLAPAGFTGSVKIVNATQLTRLGAGIGAASEVIAHWGVGMSELMKRDGE
jgi:uncharacterized membrane protein